MSDVVLVQSHNRKRFHIRNFGPKLVATLAALALAAVFLGRCIL